LPGGSPVFAGAAGLLIILALGIGVAGYHWIAGFRLIDALLNASMILGGMGPVGELHSTTAKLFASAYALFSGLVFYHGSGIAFHAAHSQDPPPLPCR